MTQAELVALIKEHCGPMVGEAVNQAVKTHIEPLKTVQTDWLSKLVGNGHEKLADAAPKREPGMAFARYVRAVGAARMSGGDPLAILKQWGDHDLVERALEYRAKALAAGDAAAGGFLVPPQFSQEVIEFLRARAVVRSLGPRTIPMPTGTFKIPKLSGGATAYYVGENVNATGSQPTTAQITLSFKKLITLVPMSNDLMRYSSPGADAIVRDDVVNAMRVREDAAFIRDDGTGSAPRGMRYWANQVNIFASNATSSVQNTFTDLGVLVQALLDANIPMISPAWIMAPRTLQYLMTLLNSQGIPVFRAELMTGRFWGWPFGVTTGVPTNLGAGANQSEIYFIDMAQAVIGEAMNLIVDASQEAAYYDGANVQAAYSLDQTVVRAIAEHDFAMRHDKAVAVMTQVTWKPGSV